MKKVIAIAVAGAFVAPLASAEVKLSGKIGGKYDYEIFEEKDNSDGFGDWGTSVDLSGDQQITDELKLSWKIGQKLNWKEKNPELDIAYLNFSGGFGSLRFGKFKTLDYSVTGGHPDKGSHAFDAESYKALGLIKYTTPNLLDGGNDLKVAFAFHYKGGETDKQSAYFLSLDYTGDFDASGKLSAQYAFSSFGDSGKYENKTDNKDNKVVSTLKRASSGVFSGPLAHYIGANYSTAKNADNSLISVGAFFKYSRGMFKKGGDPVVSVTPDSAGTGYTYDSHSEYGLKFVYDTGDLGLKPELTFARGTEINRGGKSISNTGYTAWNAKVTYKFNKIETYASYGAYNKDGPNNDYGKFSVGIRHSF